jgi:hypothetical protein
MSRLNRIIAFVAILSVPLALLGSPHGPAGRVDVLATRQATIGALADCPGSSCGRAGSIPDDDSWRAAAAADTPDAYWAYLRYHPAGAHVAEARFRLERLAVSPEPPLQFAAAETVPARSIAEAAVGEAGAPRLPAYRFPIFLLAPAPMDSAAASLAPANASIASPAVAAEPAAAQEQNGRIRDGTQPTPAAASSDGAAAPAATAALSAAAAPRALTGPPAGAVPSVKAPASTLSYAAAARSGPSRPSGFRPRRFSPRRFKLSELIAPRTVSPVHAARSKAARLRRPKQMSGVAVQPQKTPASAGRYAGSKLHVRSMRRVGRSAGPGAWSSRGRQTQHARRIAPAASPPTVVLQAPDCIWPFCFGN